MDKENQKYEKSGINKNTDKVLFEDEYYDKIDEKVLENSYSIEVIEIYTKLREKRIFTKLLKFYYKKKYTVDFSKIIYNKETGEYEYKDEFDGEIYTFNKLSNLLDEQEIKDELESDKGYKKCHSKSIELISVLPKGVILTGYVKKSYGKFLHSVVEIEKQKKSYIIDYTKNLIMPKEQYFKLTNFEEIERISDEEFFSDLIATGQLDFSRKRIFNF